MLILQVYSMCAIGPSSLKRAQLVLQVLILSCISPFTNTVNGITYVTNWTMICHYFLMMWLFLIKKLQNAQDVKPSFDFFP